MRLGRGLWRILQTSARGRHHHNSQTSLGGWLLFVHVKTLCVLVKEKSMTAVEVLWGDDSTEANIFIRHLLMNSSSFYRSVSHRRWPWTQYDLKQKSFSLISWFKMPFRAHSSGCWIDMKRGWKKKKKPPGFHWKSSTWAVETTSRPWWARKSSECFFFLIRSFWTRKEGFIRGRAIVMRHSCLINRFIKPILAGLKVDLMS